MTTYDHCRTWQELKMAAPAHMHGWMCEPEYEELFRIARQMQPGQRLLEVGIFEGTTLALFAMIAPAGVEIIGMDSWENDTPVVDRVTGESINLSTACMRNLERNGVADRVRLLEGSSHVLGPRWDQPLDVCIIDGDHSTPGVLQDLRDFAPWVRPGGLLILDDYWSATDTKVAIDVWRPQNPMWRCEWGDLLIRNAGGGVESKMLVLRRMAGGPS